MLYFSSLLFITNAIHASFVCFRKLEYLLIVLTATSILHHGKMNDNYVGKKIVHVCDVITASTVYVTSVNKLYIFFRILPINYLHYLGVSLFITISSTGALSVLFYKKLEQMKIDWRNVHLILHISTCIALHILLIKYRIAYPNKCYQIYCQNQTNMICQR